MKVRLSLPIILFLAADITLGFAKNPVSDKETYTSGYIITSSDTLNVYIKQQVNYDFGIRYKSTPEENTELLIKSKDVLLLGTSQRHYSRITVDGKSVLAEVVEAGYLTLYKHTEISYATHHVYNAKVGAFIATGGYGETQRYYIGKKGELTRVGEFMDYKRRLKKLMTEKPEFHFLVKQLRYRYIDYELQIVLRRYNELMQDPFETIPLT